MAHKYFNKIRNMARNQSSGDKLVTTDDKIISTNSIELPAKRKYTRHTNSDTISVEQPKIINISKEEGKE